MRSTWTALLLVTLVAGCEHKSKKDNAPPADKAGVGQASGATKPSDEMKPEPVAKDPAKPADPAGETVRPPVAADLDEYTKELTGKGTLHATIDTTLGAFHCELYPEKAPITVANFVGLATGKKPWMNPNTHSVEKAKPFFDGLIFHRVIPGFMVQGGDPLGQGTGGPGYEFDDEVNNGLVMKAGTLAMANAGKNRETGGGTNGSQFFITEGAPGYLNNKHTIFGQCKEVDLVKKITGVPRNEQDRPDTAVSINKITFSKE